MEKNSDAISMADVYRFLAQSMHYPTTVWFTDDYWSALFSILTQLRCDADIAALEDAKKESADFIEDLQIEYTRLFVNGVPCAIAPPYASVHYPGGDGTLYGRIAEETRMFYRGKGFILTRTNELPDHIVSELEFLALLARAKDDQGEQQFLERFFTPWFVVFRNRVLAEVCHPYYRVVLQLIDFFTREEL
ncbi:MAG: TorD/DmsD family molecular chaperone [Thermodesulfobacteriota bacterium]